MRGNGEPGDKTMYKDDGRRDETDGESVSTPLPEQTDFAAFRLEAQVINPGRRDEDSGQHHLKSLIAEFRAANPGITPEILDDLERRLHTHFGGFLQSLDTPGNQKPKEGPKVFEVGMMYEEVERQIAEYMGELLLEGFKNGRMPMPIFYFYPEKWAAVCAEKSYTLQAKAKDILDKNAEDMLDIITPEGAERVRIYDFGVGTGEKGKIIVDKAIKRKQGKVEYHGVDAGSDMLRIALEKMAKDYMGHSLLMKKENSEARKNDRWRYLIKFLRENNLEYSSQPQYLEKVFKRIFGKHCANPQNIDLLRHLFARMVSLHKKTEQSKINALDDPNVVKLPLSLHAHPVWFQSLTEKEFTPEENEGVVIFDLGSEICNQFPGKSIEMFYNLLSDPKTPNHENGLVPLKDEKSVRASYAVLGLQLGEIPRSQDHFRRTRNEMRKAYNNPAFRDLTSHPFERPDIKYTDLTTGEPTKFDKIGFIYADYEEDNDNPGYYGATHRLYITEDAEVTNAKGEKTTLKGREAAYGTFKEMVEALFDPEKEAELQGKRLEIMRVLGVSTKEELLAVDPKIFYSKDYSNYGSGIKVAEKILGRPAGLHQTLLYPSYKPTLEQMVQLCHERGMKIIKVYSDAEGNGSGRATYVKILTRRMTPEEEELYAREPNNSEFFFTCDKEADSARGIRRNNGNGETACKTVRAVRTPRCA